MNGFRLIRTIVKPAICFALLVLALAAPRALSAATVFTTVLGGANEVPPTGSGGSGTVSVTLLGNLLTVNETYTGLSGSPTGAHIHCCGPIGVTEPVAIPFNGFPTTTSGSFLNQTFDLTLAATYTAGFLTSSGGTAALAEAAVIAGLNSGQTYANIHTANFPGGEIRGQLAAAAAAPEPTTLVLGGASLLMLALLRRR
jgi:CHRD domain